MNWLPHPAEKFAKLTNHEKIINKIKINSSNRINVLLVECQGVANGVCEYGLLTSFLSGSKIFRTELEL